MSGEKSGLLGGEAPKWLAVSIAAIWIPTIGAKLYYTKRAADLIEAKGWPPARIAANPPLAAPAPGAAAGSAPVARGSAVAAPEQRDPSPLNDVASSYSLHHAWWATVVAAVGFWLLK